MPNSPVQRFVAITATSNWRGGGVGQANGGAVTLRASCQLLAGCKSSYSGSSGDSCVEVAIAEHAVHVRDSKDVTAPPSP